MSMVSSVTFASLSCQLTTEPSNQDSHVRHWSFNDKHLICDEYAQDLPFGNLEKYPLNDLLVIRGHISEINQADFKLLHHYAGYSLVQQLSSHYDQSDEHLSFIPLDKFNSINSFNATAKMGSPDIQLLVDQVDPSRWLSDITTLSSWSRQTGQPDNDSAANWIAAKFNALNFQVSLPSFQVGQNNTRNIMAIKTGSTRPDDWYLVGAHMDSTSSSDLQANAPGAVDNASGCAAVIEMARISSQYNFEGTLVFICYSGEEQGLIGSELHADTLINQGDDSKIKAALTLDMVGYTSNNDHELLLESSATYQSLMNEMAQNAATYAPGLTIQTTTNYFGSDHVSYIDNGMPGVLSIDVDYDIYPGYHRSTDLPENINTTQGEYIIITNLATLVDKAVVLGLSDLIFINGFD